MLFRSLGGHFYDLSFGQRLPDELYDLRRDPAGVNNLAHDLAYAATLAAMRTRMMKLLADEQDPRALGQAAIFDTYRYTGPRTKSYEVWLQTQEAKLGGVVPPDGPPAAKKKSGKNKAPGVTPD